MATLRGNTISTYEESVTLLYASCSTDICGGLNEKCLPCIMAHVFSVGPQLVVLLGKAYEHLGEFIVLSYSLCFIHVATCDF